MATEAFLLASAFDEVSSCLKKNAATLRRLKQQMEHGGRAIKKRRTHAMLRKIAAKELGIRNSFRGSTSEFLLALIKGGRVGVRAPAQLLTPRNLHAQHAADYNKLIGAVSLCQLAEAFPAEQWQRYKQDGWCKLSVHLSAGEKRLLALVYGVALASMGVDPRRPATYRNAEHVASYDSAYGWVRQPALISQVYLATHPRIYRLTVGLYTRLLLERYEQHAKGQALSREEEAIAVRGCIELRLQTYNSKLALPSATKRSVSHLDVEWWRGGCETPAPQCCVFTSVCRGEAQTLDYHWPRICCSPMFTHYVGAAKPLQGGLWG